MRTIHLIRHAKSSWKDKSLPDIERPLNKRGYTSCAAMAQPIIDAGCTFENVFCSNARRAQQTIQEISKALPKQDIHWSLDDELYTFDEHSLYYWLKNLDDSMNEIVVISHNPAMTDLVNFLSGAEISNIPTCGYVCLRADIDRWDHVAENTFTMEAFIKPKELKAST